MDVLLADTLAMRPWLARSRSRRAALQSGTLQLMDVDRLLATAETNLGRLAGDVLVIPVYGAIQYRMDLCCYFCGGVSVQGISNALTLGLANPACARIVLDIDSPGGTYCGTPELAESIFAARGLKPITAVVNPCCASGALWIAAAAKRVVSLRSGFVGSIGTVMELETFYRFYQEAGVDHAVLRNPPTKAEYSDVEPFSEGLLAYSQAMVDTITTEFTAAVARYRGTTPKDVAANYGQGRMLSATAAKAAGLIDAISSLETELGGKPKSGKSGPRNAFQTRLLRPSPLGQI